MTGEIVMNGVPYRPLGDACKSMRWGGFSSSEESLPSSAESSLLRSVGLRGTMISSATQTKLR